MVSTEFTTDKLKRKIKSDGIKESVIAAGDLLTRKRLGRTIFDPLVRRDIIGTVSRAELRDRASRTISITSQSPPPFVSVLEGGMILSETGLALTTEFEIIEESAAEPPQAMQAMMAMLSREFFYGFFPTRGLLRGTSSRDLPSRDLVAPLIPRYPNYYHWMVETAPKVRYLKLYEDATGENVTVLVPANAPPFVDESLRAFDWPKSKVERATKPAYKVRRLVVPSFPERTAADYDWIRRAVLDRSPPQPAEDGARNVYISRANATERRVVNEEEVMTMLSDYGFTRYRLEDRSLSENARLFNDANVVVAPHGAGITDIIFSSDCTVLELFGDKVKEPYKMLASILNLEYRAVYCKPESADIRVPVDDLESVVSAVNINR